MNSSAQRVLEYWVGRPAESPAELRQKFVRWYQAGEALDAEVRGQFMGLIEQALGGELEGWATEPRTRLALIILLDQFTRHVYRNEPRSFAGDEAAVRLALDAVERRWDGELGLEERQFLYMPLLHAEDLGLQDRCVECLEGLVSDAPPEVRELYAMGLGMAQKYRGIIARFGRFPHRNAALGRASTEEEREFLQSPASPRRS